MEDDDASFSDHSSQWGLDSDDDDEDEYGWLDAALAESKAALLRSSIVVPDAGIAALEAASAAALDEASQKLEASLAEVSMVAPEMSMVVVAPVTSRPAVVAPAVARTAIVPEVLEAMESLLEAVAAGFELVTATSDATRSEFGGFLRNSAATLLQSAVRREGRLLEVKKRRFREVLRFERLAPLEIMADSTAQCEILNSEVEKAAREAALALDLASKRDADRALALLEGEQTRALELAQRLDAELKEIEPAPPPRKRRPDRMRAGARLARWVEQKVLGRLRRASGDRRRASEELQRREALAMGRAEIESRREQLALRSAEEAARREREVMASEERATRRFALWAQKRRERTQRELCEMSTRLVGARDAADRSDAAVKAQEAASGAMNCAAQAALSAARSLSQCQKRLRQQEEAVSRQKAAEAAAEALKKKKKREQEEAEAAAAATEEEAVKKREHEAAEAAAEAVKKKREQEEAAVEAVAATAREVVEKKREATGRLWAGLSALSLQSAREQREAAVDPASRDLALSLFEKTPPGAAVERRERPKLCEATARRLAGVAWRLAYVAAPTIDDHVAASSSSKKKKKKPQESITMECLIRGADAEDLSEAQSLELSLENLGGADLGLAIAKHCPKLRALNLSLNSVDLPTMASLPPLEWLSVAGNGLDEVCPNTSSRLLYLDVESNALRTLKCFEKNKSTLRVLKAATNKISGGLRFLPGSLRRLDLAGNCLRTLQIPSLARLLDLDLSRNKLESIDGGSLSVGAPLLRRLYASGNRLEGPPQLNLDFLESLWLSNNQIQSLEAYWQSGWLPSLKELHLAHNRLQGLMPLSGFAPSLSSLDLSHNQISTSIPELAGQIPRTLADLAVRGNPCVEKPCCPPAVETRLRAAQTAWVTNSFFNDEDGRAAENSLAEITAGLMLVALSPARITTLNGQGSLPQKLINQLRWGFLPSSSSGHESASRLSALSRLFPRQCPGCGTRLALSQDLLTAVRGEKEAPPKLSCKKCATKFTLPPWPSSDEHEEKDEEEDEEVLVTRAMVEALAETRPRPRRCVWDCAEARDVASLPQGRDTADAAMLLPHGWRHRRRRKDAVCVLQSMWRGQKARSSSRPQSPAGFRAFQGAVRSRTLRRRMAAALEAARFVDADLDAIERAGPIDLRSFEEQDNEEDNVNARWAVRRQAIDADVRRQAMDAEEKNRRRREEEEEEEELLLETSRTDESSLLPAAHRPPTASSQVSSLSAAGSSRSSLNTPRLLPDIGGPRASLVKTRKKLTRPIENSRPRAPPTTSVVGRDRAALTRRRTNIAKPAWAKPPAEKA